MNDTPYKKRKPINIAYIGDFNRIDASMMARLDLIGGSPCIREFGAQLAIRSDVMSLSSSRRELTSVRRIREEHEKNGEWPEGITDRPYIKRITEEDLEWLDSFLTHPHSEMVMIGHELIASHTREMVNNGYPGSQEEAAQALSGVYPHRSRPASQDRGKQRPITQKDMMRIEMEILDCPPDDAIRSLYTERTDIRAMLRIFMKTIWLTGMRPTEIFDCRIMCGNPNRPYTIPEIAAMEKDFDRAVKSGMMIPQEALDPRESLNLEQGVLKSVDQTGINPILVILNAKTTNGRKGVVQKFRYQSLKGISEEDLHVLCRAASIHNVPLPEVRRKNIISSVTRALRGLSNEILPEFDPPLNLYAFRHDFATRARRVMSTHRVAALMGHTSKSSTRGYGKPRTRKGSSGSGGWIPGCDEVAAERILNAIGPETASPDMDVEPDDDRGLST